MKNFLFKQLFVSARLPVIFIGFNWLVFFIQSSGTSVFLTWGVLPREAKGLPGIVSSVFVHGDLNHIISNTLPILALGTMMFYFYKKIATQTIIWIWLISGIWLWLGGRNSASHPTYHIGASTLVYGLASFIFFSGVFRKHLRLMVVSALVVFLYGGIVWGIFPLKQEISWEGHLFGTLAGLLVAFNYRKEGPQPKVYVWEDEDDEDELPPEDLQQDINGGGITINYVYKEKSAE